MNPILRNIPNGVTCLNVLSGTVAILAAAHPAEIWHGLTGLQWAWILVGIAAAADFCDGLTARVLGAYSDLGKELDSLCDLVSFGVAPAVMAHQCIMLNGGAAWLAWCVPLTTVCGALRLARFNVTPENTRTFTGLPIPANAIFWIGFTAWYTDLQTMPAWITAMAIAATGWLMVSPLKLFTLKFKNWGLRGNIHRWLLIAAAPAICLCTGVAGLMWIVVIYLCLSVALQTKLHGQ